MAIYVIGPDATIARYLSAIIWVGGKGTQPSQRTLSTTSLKKARSEGMLMA